MRARNISTRLCTTRVGSRRSGNTRAKLSAKPRRRSAIARSITPPFEVRRPPSKAAVTFLASTAGNENGRIVSWVMAGVAFATEGDGFGFATESYAASALYTTLASLSGALWRIRRVRLGEEAKTAEAQDHHRWDCSGSQSAALVKVVDTLPAVTSASFRFGWNTAASMP